MAGVSAREAEVEEAGDAGAPRWKLRSSRWKNSVDDWRVTPERQNCARTTIQNPRVAGDGEAGEGEDAVVRSVEVDVVLGAAVDDARVEV